MRLALAGIAIGLFACWLLVLLWRREVQRLALALRRAAAFGETPEGSRTALPRLPGLAALAREAERAGRDAAARAAAIGRQQRADEAIVERLPDPLLLLGDDRTVRRANAAARFAFGADTPAVLRHPTLRAAIDRAQALGLPQTAELRLPVPVAREVYATVIHLSQEDGQTVVVLSDRTRERAVERMREDFVANASHELRTPLASLIGFIDTLRGPAADDPPAQQRFLGIMAEQAARMNRLIDDLLSLSRIELTEHLPPSDRVDLAALIPRIVAGFEPRLASRKVSVQVTLDPALPAITGDADQLAQVLQNLLDNAVKYGREGGSVRLTAGLALPPRRAGVLVSVVDDGPGIARPHLARLTERFYRVDEGRSRNAGGTGLGLAIVKHIVNRHRGQLLIESEEGCGSTFSIWLPPAP